MADGKVTKSEKSYIVTDGEKRGPLTMSRVRFHSAGRHVLAACADRRLALWDLEGEPVKEKSREGVPGKLVCPHDAGWVRGFDVHPRGEAIVTGGSDRRVRLAEWKKNPNGKLSPPALPPFPGREIAPIKRSDFAFGVAFSPDDKRLATGSANGSVEVWNVE